MDDSFQLLSSMSPKFSKYKTTAKKKAPTKLALNKIIRRSSIYDKLPITSRNANISVVDRLTESSDSNSGKIPIIVLDSDSDEKSVKSHKSAMEGTVVIPDSGESETEIKSEDDLQHINSKYITVRKRNIVRKTSPKCNLNKENLKNIESNCLSTNKYNSIQSWISNIEADKHEVEDSTNMSVFSQISIIQGDVELKEFSPAINSTLVNDGCPRFDELFKHNRIVEPRKEIENHTKDQSKPKTIHINKKVSKINFDNLSKRKSDKQDAKIDRNKKIELAFKNKMEGIENMLICKNQISVDQKENDKNLLNDSVDKISNTSKSEGDDLEQEKLLDEIYGKQWRQNRDQVLPKSEPRRKKKMEKSKIIPQTEIKRKPKMSITHKNPYLDSEKEKSLDLLKTLQTLRINAAIESPYFKRFRQLADPETDTSEGEKSPRIKLNFGSENSDEKKDIYTNHRKNKSSGSSTNSVSSGNKDEFDDFFENNESLEEKLKKKTKRIGLGNKTANPDNSNLLGTANSKIDFKAKKVMEHKMIQDTLGKTKMADIEQNMTHRIKERGQSFRKNNDIREVLRCSILEESFSDYSDIGETLEDKLKKKSKEKSDDKKKSTNSEFPNSSKIVKTKKKTVAISSSSNSSDILAKEIITNLETQFNDTFNNVLKSLEPKQTKIKDTKIDKGKKKINEKPKKTQTKNMDAKIPKSKKTSKNTNTVLSDSSSSSYESFKKPAVTNLHRNGPQSFLASLSKSVSDSNCDASAKLYRNCFKQFRAELLTKLFKLYNQEIFENCIPDDAPIEWSDRMTGTAGFCYCRKVTRRTGLIERKVRFVLSTKVLDSACRLRDTLVHEMCHAATWIVNQVADGHGPFWKSWANKAMKTFPELPQIKRCHDYTINTKYTYKCTECGYSFGRHSKSLNLQTKRCGHCSGKFEVLINKTTKAGEVKSLPVTPKRQATGFALFVKENYANYKSPLVKHADVMRQLGQKFQELKVDKK